MATNPASRIGIPRSSGALPRFWRILSGAVAGIGNERQILQERFAVRFGKRAQNLALQLEREEPGNLVGLAAVRQQPDAMGAAVGLMRFALYQFIRFHPFEQRGDGVWVARNGFGDFSLGESFWIRLDQRAENGELVRSDFEVMNSPTERLVQSVPGSPQ